MRVFLRQAFQVLTPAFLIQLCLAGSAFAQLPSTQPPPFGDKHVGGDIPIDERLAKPINSNRPAAEARVITNGRLAPSKEDRLAFAAFLQMPNTGLIRLLQFAKFRFRPGPTANPGGGAYYSFANLSHFLKDGSDIGLIGDQLAVGSVSGYGFLSNLGDVPLENVSLTDPRASFLASYEPAITNLQARAEIVRSRQTFTIEGNSYQSTLPVELNSTYLVRSINYGKPLFGRNSSSRSGNARSADVLVAFRVVRKDVDGSLIILWKLMKKYPGPKLD
jgi:hypothetical protein